MTSSSWVPLSFDFPGLNNKFLKKEKKKFQQ